MRPPPLTRNQHRVRSSPARFKFLAKGRRWGGNELLTSQCIEKAAIFGKSVCFLSPAYTSNSFKRAWRYFTHYTSMVKKAKTLVAVKEHYFPTGGFIHMRSADHIDAVRGEAYDFIAVDEGAFFEKLREDWEHVLRPSLMDTQGEAIVDSSPNGFDDFYELWAMGNDPDFPDWESWQFPTWTNSFINPVEIESMRREMNELTFRQEVGAEFVAREGRVFGEFQRSRNVRDYIAYDPRLKLGIGLDFGYRSMAAVIAQPGGNGKRTLSVIGENLWTERQIEPNLVDLRAKCKALGIQHVDTIGCDPSGDARQDRVHLTSVDYVRKHFPEASVGYSTNPRHKNPEWRAGELRNLIYAADAQARLFVDAKCKHTIATLEKSVYPKHKPGQPLKEDPIKDGKIDHVRDALGYLMVRLFNLAQSRNEEW